MVINNIQVRADFIDEEIIPFCFQPKQSAEVYYIGRIVKTETRPLDGHTEYTCRLKNSDRIVTLILDIEYNLLRWSIDMGNCSVETESVVSEQVTKC